MHGTMNVKKKDYMRFAAYMAISIIEFIKYSFSSIL